jgi:hypothetical protein
MKALSQDSRSAGRDLNLGPPKNEAGLFCCPPHIVRFSGMLKNPSKHEIFRRLSKSFPSPVPTALLLDNCW